MSTNDHRKCSNCGITRSEDKTVTYHRFPNPGNSNITKSRAWAQYCWPDQDWTSEESLMSLHKSSKVLCSRLFNSSQFYDDCRQKLSKFAVPDETIMFEVLEIKKMSTRSDQQLSGIDPKLKIEMDPLAHRDLRPEMMFIREELRQAKWQTLAVRRTALKKLLLKDFEQEDCELKNIGLSYAPPDP